METTLINPKQIRENLGLTQFEMAQKAGRSHSTIQKFEAGSLESPTGLTRGKLAIAYGVQVEQVDAYLESHAQTSPQAA